MKLKTNKFLAVLCTVAMIMTMILPMFVFTVTAADEATATLNFAEASNCKSITTTEQRWEENGLTIIGTKGSSTTNVNNYTPSDHARFYKSSNATVTCNHGDITKIVFNCTKVDGEPDVTNGEVSVSGKIITITMNEPTESVELVFAGGQIRVSDMTVTYAEATTEPDPDPSEPAAPSIKVTGDNYTAVGTNITLQATVENVTGDATVTWESSDEEIATVVDGVVTPVAMGKVTITATVGEVSAEKEITVYPAAGEITIAEALKVCELTGTSNAPYTYSVKGTVKSTEYKKQYQSSNTYITDGVDTLYAYGLKGGELLTVGQVIIVTGTLVNYQGNTSEFTMNCTYVNFLNETLKDVLEVLDAIQASSSLGFRYSAQTVIENVTPSAEVITDTLTRELTGVAEGSQTYSSWEGKTSKSSAVYAGQSAGGNDSIQLRSKNNNSGIVTTVSGGKKVTKIIVTWNSNTSTTGNRSLEVYGKNTAYTNPTELYNSPNQGTHLGSIVCGTATALEIEGDYAFIGLRSKDGAVYIDEIQIIWAGEGDATEGPTTVEKIVCDEGSEFSFRFELDSALAEIENIDENGYGIYVKAGDKVKIYLLSDENTAKYVKEADGKVYVTIKLGDIINNKDKLGMEFTVRACVVVDGVTYISETAETFSVASRVEEYHDAGKDVENLYNYLVQEKLIQE